MAREKRLAGVELHGNSFRYRQRIQGKDDEGNTKKRVAVYKRWAFLVGAEASRLRPDDPLRRENALANANAFALADRNHRLSPQRKGGWRDAEGTMLEWLVRYQTEALESRRYQPEYLPLIVERIHQRLDKKLREELPPDPVPHNKLQFHIGPRAETGVETDASNIRSIFRLAREHVEIHDMLHRHVEDIGIQDMHLLLGQWSGGKAKPATKRRVIDTLAAAWNHHKQFHGMKPAKPWQDLVIEGDAAEPKARAIPKAELARLEAEFGNLHPVVRGCIEFLRHTGARRSEAAKMRWERILWPEAGAGAPSAHFKRTKAKRGTYRARFVYLDEECLVALARMVRPVDGKGRAIAYDPATFNWRKFNWPTHGWMFPAPQSPERHISGETIYQAFVRGVRRARIPHASPHHLRHTKATVLTALVPQAMAQEMLGHEDASTFAIYRHLAEEAGYMVRDKRGALVNAEELQSREGIAQAMKKLPKAERAALLAELLAD